MQQAGNVLLNILLAITMVAGLFGLLIPYVPGLTIIWTATLVYGLVNGFSLAGAILFGGITLLMLFGNIVDNIIMGAGAHQGGASWWSVAVSLVLGIAGTLIWPPFGGLIASLIGIFLVEWIRLKDWKKAWSSFKGMALGCGWAVVARFAIGIVMIVLWVVWVFFAPVTG